MVTIKSCWDDKRSQLLDQAAPILDSLTDILDCFEDPEVGYFGLKSMYVRLSARGVVLEHATIDSLLLAAEINGAVLSIDTRGGPLVATIMKQDNAF